MRLTFTRICLALALASCSGRPAAPPEPRRTNDTARAKELMRAVQSAWRDAETLSVEMEESYAGHPERDRKRLLLKRPDRVRWDDPPEGKESNHYVFDGRNGWGFFDGKNSYTKHPGEAAWTDYDAGPLVSLFFQMDPDEILEESMMADEVAIRHDLLGEELCEIIRWKCPGLARNGEAELWIDSTSRPRRFYLAQTPYGMDPTDGQIKPFPQGRDSPRFFKTVDYVAIERSKPLSDDLFAFTPPPDAENKGADLLAAGTLAPVFEAVRLDGQVVRLSEFRGRPVLLNFWSAG